MTKRIQTEYSWVCNKCGFILGPFEERETIDIWAEVHAGSYKHHSGRLTITKVVELLK